MMRIFLTTAAVSAALAVSAGAALAADIPEPMEPAPAYESTPAFSWSGPYVGAHIGYAWGQFETRTPASAVDIGGDGFVGGLLAGFNYQFNQFVVGVEGDWSWTNFDGSAAIPATTIRGEADWFATLRARAGVAMDRYLVYGTGGVAFTDLSLAGFGGPDGANLTGWTIGAGVEAAVTDNVTLRAEYAYMDFPEKWYNLGATPVRTDLDSHTIRLGVAYKFN
ncbi:MAG: porin family protein, partial [Hyphomicrobiales bacterium]|nr:porin family protein [Hyphomicrobiales bacterium]